MRMQRPNGSRQVKTKMRVRKHFDGRQPDGGFSMVELLTVVTIILAMAAIALPQLISARRLVRSAGMSREILTQLRVARQEAMSQMRAMTFQYDDSTKQIKIIEHAAPAAGTALSTYRTTILSDASYPNTPGSFVMRTTLLAVGGVPASEITYGIPSGLPTGALGDTATMTSLSSSKLNITFFYDGSATDKANDTKMALFFYNPKNPGGTAIAVSVLGSAGRAKVWRYSSSANSYKE